MVRGGHDFCSSLYCLHSTFYCLLGVLTDESKTIKSVKSKFKQCSVASIAQPLGRKECLTITTRTLVFRTVDFHCSTLSESRLLIKGKFYGSSEIILFQSTHYRPAMPFGNRKILDLFSSVLSQFTNYHQPSRNLKFNYLGIFQSLKLRILMEKIFSILISWISPKILWAVMG